LRAVKAKDPPEVFEAMVNDDDLKPPREAHGLDSPPMPSLDDAEEEEEDEEEGEGEGEGEGIPPTKEEKSLMMKAFANMSSASNDVLPNPVLADKLVTVIKRKFKDRAVTLSLKDPFANLRMTTNKIAILTVGCAVAISVLLSTLTIWALLRTWQEVKSWLPASGSMMMVRQESAYPWLTMVSWRWRIRI